jgi:hypothetical protein
VLRRRARHRHFDRAALAAPLAALLLLGAGCGDGDEAEDGFPPGVAQPQTKVEFLREADRICLSQDAQIEAAADDLVNAPGRPPPAQVRRLALGIVVPALEAEVRAIGALPVPVGDEREVEAILAATERGIAQIEADPASLVDGPPPGLREAGRLAERYGSRQCGVR